MPLDVNAPLDSKNFYIIRTARGTASIMVRRGDGAPTIRGGGARYDIIERPRRKSLVQWAGDDVYRMDLPIMFDGWADNNSVETDIAKLNQLMHSQAELTAPSMVLIEGAVPVKGARWVIEGIDWGDRVIWMSDKRGKGYRLRQDAVVHLLQYNTGSTLAVQNPTTAVKLHTVKTGETVRKIAAKHGVSSDDVKKANNIRDPKSVKTGDTLKIPPSSSGTAHADVTVDPNMKTHTSRATLV